MSKKSLQPVFVHFVILKLLPYTLMLSFAMAGMSAIPAHVETAWVLLLQLGGVLLILQILVLMTHEIQPLKDLYDAHHS